MKKTSPYATTAVVAVIVGAVAFYGGMQFQQRRLPRSMNGQFSFRSGTDGKEVGLAGGNRQGMQNGMKPVAGEIISQDETSLTVKMPDGSTKIVILSDQTAINKASEGSKDDLKVGEQVTAFGTQNQDGSVTAQNIAVGGGMMRANANN